MMKSISQSARENQSFADEQATLVNQTSVYTSEIAASIQKNTVDADAQLQGARHIQDYVKNIIGNMYIVMYVVNICFTIVSL